MENIKYLYQECGYESQIPGMCPGCQLPLVASCPWCGNPVVGEHVQLEV
jgi:hypothetical protein